MLPRDGGLNRGPLNYIFFFIVEFVRGPSDSSSQQFVPFARNSSSRNDYRIIRSRERIYLTLLTIFIIRFNHQHSITKCNSVVRHATLKYAENCRFATNAIITSPTEKMFSNDREIASGNRSKRNSATLVHVSATPPRVALGSNYYRYTDTRSSTNYPPTFKPGREEE